MSNLKLILENWDLIAAIIAGVTAAVQMIRNNNLKGGLHQLLVTIGEFNDSKLADKIYESNNKVVEVELPKSGATIIK